MNFPTDAGIGTVRGDQKKARKCYNVSLKAPVMMVREEGPEKSEASEVQGVQESGPDELDPRVQEERSIEPIEEVEEVVLDTSTPDRKIKVGGSLNVEIREALVGFLRENQDVFAWSHSDMTGIDPNIICHALNVDPSFAPVQQKQQTFDQTRKKALKVEVDKLLSNGFI